MPSKTGAAPDYDAVVIGAGFAGLYMVYRLREAGFSVLGLEAGDGVGGTWYWNRYPGRAVRLRVMYYSFSFLPDLEQEWPLEERYPTQPVILRYLQTVADRLDLRRTSPSAPGWTASATTTRPAGGRCGPGERLTGDRALRHHRDRVRCRPRTGRSSTGADGLRRRSSTRPRAGRGSRSPSPAGGSG